MAKLLHTLASPAASRAAKLGYLLILPLLIISALGWRGFQFAQELQQEAPARSDKANVQTLSTEKSTLDKSLLGLFGAPGQERTEQAQRTENLPESNLDLQVSAIFYMATPEQSSVILEDGNRTLILKPGEEARPGISVESIESNRVTLKRNGKLEQLSFRGFSEGEGNHPGDPFPAPEIVTPPAHASTAPASPAAVAEQAAPTAYQQFIQRKLAQNK